ncbi:uncharacterized protein [Littorina saxatilis]|uniref:uncharacterized protein n=1 Tax=Littorina saxatilis TaxID=31220 RepID=UPI0038B59844
MTCPSRLVEEEVNGVTCRINTTEISNTRCVSPPSNVLFQIKGQVNPLCTSLYTSSCSTSPDLIDEGSCGCTEQTGDVKIYLFKFKGNATDYNGTKLECTVCASIPEIKIPPTNCDSLKYGPKDVAVAAVVSSDEEGSSSSNLGLIIGATTGGVVVVAMVIGTAMYCHKGRSSSGHNVHSNTRSDTPPPAVGTASHSADRGLAATRDVKPREEEAGENDSEASEATEC